MTSLKFRIVQALANYVVGLFHKEADRLLTASQRHADNSIALQDKHEQLKAELQQRIAKLKQEFAVKLAQVADDVLEHEDGSEDAKALAADIRIKAEKLGDALGVK